MLSDLNALRVFEKVVLTGSFTAAAKALTMPKSTVSQRVAELEERLGARLLQRTTRRLSLTDQGRIYYEHCTRILASVDDAERAVNELQDGPRGLLRITVPASMQFLGPALAEFLGRSGAVQLEVLCADRVVNLVEESFDLAIRAGTLSDSSHVARNLGVIPFVVVASPEYSKTHGRPRAPKDLTKHRGLYFRMGAAGRTWKLVRRGETQEVPVTPVLSANDFDILQDSALAGVGIAMLPAFRCVDDIRAKRLERLLPEWAPPPQPFHAMYPSARHLSPKVKAILDHLQNMPLAPWSRA